MLAKSPQDLEQLADAVAFQKKLVDDKARIVGRFEPLRCVHTGSCDYSTSIAGVIATCTSSGQHYTNTSI
jgi:hypothetical protein